MNSMILNCLKIRLDWYKKSIDMMTGAIPYENGFDYPCCTSNSPYTDATCVCEWRGAAREIQNTINMMEVNIYE